MNQLTASISVALASIPNDPQNVNRRWVHLLPNGTFDAVDGRGPWRLSNPDEVIANTRKYTGQRQIVIDYDHQTVGADKGNARAIAAGWLVGLEARADGIWGLAEFTDTAAEHIKNREYRYLSPVFSYVKDGKIVCIKSAALTNSPALDTLTALARSEDTMDNNLSVEELKQAALALGLPADADANAIAAKIAELKKLIAGFEGTPELVPAPNETAQNSAAPDPSKFVPIGDFRRAISEINRLNSGISKQDAEAHVALSIRSGTIPPFARDWAISLCTVNKPAFDEFAKGIGPSFRKILEPQVRYASQPRTSDKNNSALDADEIAVCKRMGLTEKEFINARSSAQTNLE